MHYILALNTLKHLWSVYFGIFCIADLCTHHTGTVVRGFEGCFQVLYTSWQCLLSGSYHSKRSYRSASADISRIIDTSALYLVITRVDMTSENILSHAYFAKVYTDVQDRPGRTGRSSVPAWWHRHQTKHFYHEKVFLSVKLHSARPQQRPSAYNAGEEIHQIKQILMLFEWWWQQKSTQAWGGRHPNPMFLRPVLPLQSGVQARSNHADTLHDIPGQPHVVRPPCQQGSDKPHQPWSCDKIANPKITKCTSGRTRCSSVEGGGDRGFAPPCESCELP